MRKLAVVLLAFTAFTVGLAQGQFNYAPDGEPLQPGNGSINEITAKYFPGVPFITEIVDSSEEGLTFVVYKLFTDEPLFVGTRQPERITESVASFNLDDYLHSSDLTYELSKRVGELTDSYTLSTLGGPSDRIASNDGDGTFEQWRYEDLGVTLFFRDSILDSYVEH